MISVYENFLFSLTLILPLVISGFLHMFIVKKNLFSVLNKPISVDLFGRNKTYRGFVAMPVLTYIGLLCSNWISYFKNHQFNQVQILSLGLLLGLFYALFELPNSWMKRRLNIEPGKTPNKNKALFIFIDQADSVMGCLFAYALFMDLTILTVVFVIFLGPSLHLMVNFVLYLFKLRKEPM